MPDHINLVFLSATTPNMVEFSEWVGTTKRKNVYVISTLKRPVPLEHFAYAAGSIGKVMDATGHFNAAALAAVAAAAKEAEEKGKGQGARSGGRGRGGGSGGRGIGRQAQQSKAKQKQKLHAAANKKAAAKRAATAAGVRKVGAGGQHGIRGLVQTLASADFDLLPVIIFSFSKRKCAECAERLGTLDLLPDKRGKSAVHVFCSRALERLAPPDRELPQIASTLTLLSRGIGVHHGGLLPIVKEMVEILFSRGLVKCLFATETFAMGVNMPARCVVFNGVRKHDGVQFRDILPGEYTQMAGRAGRRGLDATGTVIVADTGGGGRCVVIVAVIFIAIALFCSSALTLPPQRTTRRDAKPRHDAMPCCHPTPISHCNELRPHASQRNVRHHTTPHHTT